MNKYRVLIIDDRLNNLEMARDVILSTYQPFDKIWNIEIEIAHIQVYQDSDKYHIDKQSIIKIAELSSKPFDLLLFDIAYYLKGGSEKIYEELSSKYDENYSFDILEEYVFNPKTLVKEGCKQLKESHEKDLYKYFNKNFVGHKGGIYGYTFIEEKWKNLFYDLDYCRNMLIKTFPQTDPKRIVMKGTRKEIFNDSFGHIRTENERYYSFILAKYLEQLINIEITKQEIEAAKYIKIKRTSKVIGSLVFFCVLLGACSEFFGSLIIGLFEKGENLTASIFICFTILGIVLGGKFVLHFIESLMPKLFNDKTEDERF